MTELQQAAQQALKILDSEFTTLNGEFCRWCDGRLNAKHNCALEQTITALRAALAEPQSTHSADCYKWHHECAIARIEETEELREALKAELERTLTDEQISDLWHQSGEQPFKFARMLLK
jgi:hypothetical protein